jgi:hypothetical protein
MDAATPNGKYIFHLKKEKSDERRIEEKEKKNKNITSSPPKHIDADYIVLRIPASLYGLICLPQVLAKERKRPRKNRVLPHII